MTVEFIGMLAAQESSEIIAPHGPIIDPGYLRDWALAHEAGGFDRVLVGYFPGAADGFVIAQHVLSSTTRLSALLAHRPGFVSPTLAARKFATLDQISGGRIAIHVITGGSDIDQRHDGDWTDKETRYRRTDEYVGLLRRIWSETAHFDHEGEFYKTKNSYSNIRCVQQPHIPVFFGGSSDDALEVSGKHADTYALWGEPLDEAAAHIAKVKEAAAVYGRNPRISLSLRPILADTDELAWTRAYDILARIKARTGGRTPPPPNNVGSQRLLAAASRGDVLDRCLFLPLATVTGAPGNSTALVGSPETVAAAMLDYADIGVDTFLIRGYEPFADTIDYGARLLPLVRSKMAARSLAAV